MNYWLVKSDPDTYGWKELVHDKSTAWTGVKSHPAKLNLQAMKKGDLVLFYHSQEEKSVVGISKVVKEFYPDPTVAKDEPWVAVDLAPVKPLKKPVTLSQIKADKRLLQTYLVRQGRLSVMPLKKEEYDAMIELSE